MRQAERDWLDWLKRARDGQVTQRFAAEKMGISDRWVRALLCEMRVKGDAVVVHGLRGRPSNRRIDEEIRARAMEMVKSADWHDFKPTFATEQLAKRQQIEVSKETVRQWMIAEGIWQAKQRQVGEVHTWRPRRSHYGELVQGDTSDHDWLEGRGEPVHHLVRMIDDATSRSWGRFVQRDGTRENMGVLWDYVERFGRAVDYYTDHDSMFAVAPRPGESKEQQRVADRLTQIGRALRDRLDSSLLPTSQGSGFTLHLIEAIQHQFLRSRIRAFVDELSREKRVWRLIQALPFVVVAVGV